MTNSTLTRITQMLQQKKMLVAVITIMAVTLIGTGGWWLTSAPTEQAEEITMYKNIGCGCCSRWADHLKAKGHKVIEKGVADLDAIKTRFNIKEKFQGCHTTLIGGYVIEGHVPMKEIDRILRERPDAKGLSVPGMPMGSPGMEAPGETPDNYTVFLMKKDGTSEIYAKY